MAGNRAKARAPAGEMIARIGAKSADCTEAVESFTENQEREPRPDGIHVPPFAVPMIECRFL
jgi:hypothetical protein